MAGSARGLCQGGLWTRPASLGGQKGPGRYRPAGFWTGNSSQMQAGPNATGRKRTHCVWTILRPVAGLSYIWGNFSVQKPAACNGPGLLSAPERMAASENRPDTGPGRNRPKSAGRMAAIKNPLSNRAGGVFWCKSLGENVVHSLNRRLWAAIFYFIEKCCNRSGC